MSKKTKIVLGVTATAGVVAAAAGLAATKTGRRIGRKAKQKVAKLMRSELVRDVKTLATSAATVAMRKGASKARLASDEAIRSLEERAEHAIASGRRARSSSASRSSARRSLARN